MITKVNVVSESFLSPVNLVITYKGGAKYHARQVTNLQINEAEGGGYNLTYSQELFKFEDQNFGESLMTGNKHVSVTSGDVTQVKVIGYTQKMVRYTTTYNLTK